MTHKIQFKINLNELLGLFSCLGLERKRPSVSSWVVNKPLEVMTVWKRRFEGWLWGLLLPEMAPYVEPLGLEEEKIFGRLRRCSITMATKETTAEKNRAQQSELREVLCCLVRDFLCVLCYCWYLGCGLSKFVWFRATTL